MAGLAFGYQPQDDVVADIWEGSVRLVTRRVSSTYWLFRDILPMQSACTVVAPSIVRQRYLSEVEKIMLAHTL